ncbi:DUF4352 domain-containing protein [Furfurilactobacillus rossiae]|uniref:DUF4352 domain-containing protein n=1 Tax=Furfurilactobacillus rossiae TaxID=231049 RepID=UPI001265E769|nr:DUF4352 domain-containing protein [Furfurilactobacillus rossiae]QFR68016.1 DUF4352 domain-containing protein [Furfurilactobacillus rossiae]
MKLRKKAIVASLVGLIGIIAIGIGCLWFSGIITGANECVTIRSGKYIMPRQTITTSKKDGFLALQLKVKNVGHKRQSFSYSNFRLKSIQDKQREVIPEVNSSTSGSLRLKRGEQGNVWVTFKVKKDQRYRLIMHFIDGHGHRRFSETIVNAKKYKDHTRDSGIATQQFVERVFLNKQHLAGDGELSNNIRIARHQFNKQMESNVNKKVFNNGNNANNNWQVRKSIQSINKSVDKTVYKVKSNKNGKAVVTVIPRALDMKDTSALTPIREQFHSTLLSNDEDSSPVVDGTIGANGQIAKNFKRSISCMANHQV